MWQLNTTVSMQHIRPACFGVAAAIAIAVAIRKAVFTWLRSPCWRATSPTCPCRRASGGPEKVKA